MAKSYAKAHLPPRAPSSGDFPELTMTTASIPTMAKSYAKAHLPPFAPSPGAFATSTMATTTRSKKQNVSSPAAVAVYHTTELLERILGQLPAKKLLHFSLVSRRVHDIVHRSPVALHDLIFTGIDNTSRLGLPKLNPALPLVKAPKGKPMKFPEGCAVRLMKDLWPHHTWITEIMCHLLVHHLTREQLLWKQRIPDLERKHERQRLPVWHVRREVVWRLQDRNSSWWNKIWLRADKGPVEVHVLGGFRCFYAKTVAEVVAWHSPTYTGFLTDEVWKWRLQTFGTPEEVIEELGLKDVVPFDGKGSIPE